MTGAVSGYVGGLISGGISDSLGVTNNAYTTTLINNYATYGIGRLLGSGEEFDMNKIGEVDTINLVVQDMYQKYQAGKAAEAEANRGAMQKGAVKAAELADAGSAAAPVNKFPGDPFAQLDSALSGIFTSFGRGLGQTMADIGGAIKDGAVEAWGGIKTGVAAAWDGVSTVASTIAGEISDFAESVNNKITYGKFGTDENPEVKKAVAMNKLDEYVSEGRIQKDSLEYLQIKQQIVGLDEDEMSKLNNLESQEAMGIRFETAAYLEGNGYEVKKVSDSRIDYQETVKELGPFAWVAYLAAKTAEYFAGDEATSGKIFIDGKEIIANKNGVNNGGKGFDQYSLDLKGADTACVFCSTYIAAGIVSENKLNSIKDTFNNANPEYADDNMFASSYQGVGNSANATDVVFDERGTWIDKNTGNDSTDKVVDNATGVQEMVNVLDNKGAIQIRVSNDLPKTGHTATINGYTFDQNGNLIFTVIDTGKNKNTYYDPQKRQMFKYINNSRVYDRAKNVDRYINNYRRVQKNRGNIGRCIKI